MYMVDGNTNTLETVFQQKGEIYDLMDTIRSGLVLALSGLELVYLGTALIPLDDAP